MGRPLKTGLDYFPVDTDIFEDEKIRFIIAKCGLIAASILFILLCRIYRNGAFIKWDEDAEILFSAGFGKMITRIKIQAIIDESLKRDFFSQEMFTRHKILTSKGIQKRFINVCSSLHRKSTLLESYLISSEETTSQPEVNSEESAQMKLNEMKLNEMKLNEMKLNETREQPESAEETTKNQKNNSLNSQKTHGYVLTEAEEAECSAAAKRLHRLYNG